MEIINKTVLITGGGSGIGLQIAKLLGEQGNRIIITGRTEAKLQKAILEISNASYQVCDITDEHEVKDLVEHVSSVYGKLDILINNAGNATLYDLFGDAASDLAADEMITNYLSVIKLTNRFLPLLKISAEGAIVNVSSIVAFAPGAALAGYSASKAALHSYSQSSRLLLAKSSNIKVYELMPPLVNTEFSKDIGGANGMPPEDVAQALLDGLINNVYEIHVGQTAEFYKYHLSSPEEAFKAMNQ